MKKNMLYLFYLPLSLWIGACAGGSLTDQFMENLSASDGVVEVEATQHLSDGTEGEITPEGTKIFTNDLGYEIELKQGELHFHDFALLSEGDDPLCQGGFDKILSLHTAQDLLEEDLLTQHLGSALLSMAYYCRYEIRLGSSDPTQVKFHEGEGSGTDTAAEAFHLSGTWSLGAESGEFSFTGEDPLAVMGVFMAMENGAVIEHPLHFHEGERVISAVFGTQYDILFDGVDFKSQGAETQLEMIYQNFQDAIHQHLGEHQHPDEMQP